MQTAFARRAPSSGRQLERHRAPAEIATMEFGIMKRASDTQPVVGPDPFPRPAWRPSMSEFQRRALENAEYRREVGHAEAVAPKHPKEKPVAASPQPERPAPALHCSAPRAFQIHCGTLLRLAARLKRFFGK
jgi:hypothetical protein